MIIVGTPLLKVGPACERVAEAIEAQTGTETGIDRNNASAGVDGGSH